MLSRGYQPDWLYESLPYLYFIIGLSVMFGLGGFVGIVCGLLLISASLLILKMRRDYRRRIREESDAIGDSLPGETRGDQLVRLNWQPSFEVGHEVIDRQHRRLFSLGNQLINALMTKKSHGDIDLLLSDLVDEIVEHFRSEEEIMANLGVPLNDIHKGIHRALEARVRDLQERFQQGRLPSSELVGFLAYDVVSEHIMKEDLKFSPDCQRASQSSADSAPNRLASARQ